ncbi:MAG: hypothetical protein WAL52_14585 [Candidatus Sulfotelmatobacter sp.]
MRFQDVRLKGLGAGLLSAGLLGLVLGTCGTVKAQDARDEAKPQQEEPKQDEAKPAQPKAEPKDAKPMQEQPTPKAEEGKPAKNDKMDKQDEKRNNEMKPAQEQNRPMQNNNNDRAMQNGGDHAKPAANQRGQRIPEDKFRANFGRQHTFRVQTQVVQGQPRFQYGGYWFALANPWPGDWAYTDDCYVDYIDGEYVLIDLLHPGVEIPLVVVVE